MDLTHLLSTSDDHVIAPNGQIQHPRLPASSQASKWVPFIIPKEERVETLLALGRILQHSSVNREVMTILLRETNRRYCKPRLSERMMQQLVSKLQWNADGVSPNSVEPPLFSSLSGGQSRPGWDIIEDLPGSVALLSNKPRMGALWLGMGLAITLATGSFMLDGLPQREGMGLYLGLDEEQVRLYHLARSWVCEHVAGDVAIWESALNASNLNCLERIETWLQTLSAPQRLIVIDTLAQSCPASGKYAEEYDVLGEICGLARRAQTALLVLHPLPRDGSVKLWDKRLAAALHDPICAFLSIFNTTQMSMQSLTYDEATQRWIMLSYEGK